MVKIADKDNPVKTNSHNVDANTDKDNERDQIDAIGKKNSDTKVLLERDSMDVTVSLMGTQGKCWTNHVQHPKHLHQKLANSKDKHVISMSLNVYFVTSSHLKFSIVKFSPA